METCKDCKGTGMITMFQTSEVCRECDGSGKLYDCVECQDTYFKGEFACQSCCPHNGYDHGICLDCSKDCTETLIARAESMMEDR